MTNAAGGNQDAPQAELERPPAELGQSAAPTPGPIGYGALSAALAVAQGASIGGAVLSGAATAIGTAVGGPIGGIVANTIVSAVFGGSKKGRSKRRDARAAEVSIETEGSILRFAYGPVKLVGVPYYGAVASDFVVRGTQDGFQYMGSLQGQSGKRNQFLLGQFDIAVGDLERIVAAAGEGLSFGSAPTGSGLEPGSRHAVLERAPFGRASYMARFFTMGRTSIGSDRTGTGTNNRDEDSTNIGKTFVSCVFKRGYKSDDVIYGKRFPPLEVWALGEKLLTVNADSTLGDPAYSTNPSLALLTYLLNQHYGPRKAGVINESLVSLPHAREAGRRAAVTTKGPGSILEQPGMVSSMQMERFGEALDAAGQARTNNILAAYRAWAAGLNLSPGAGGWRDFGASIPTGGGGFFGSLNLSQYMVADSFETDVDVLRTVLQILDSTVDSILFWTRDRKLAWDFPDAYRTAADQSVGTLTDDDLLSSVTFTAPDPDDVANRIHITFDDVAKYNERSTVTFPRRGSVWDTALAELDGGVALENEYSPFGIFHQDQAKAWCAATILSARRWTLSFDLPWRFSSLEPGEIVRLDIDAIQSYDGYLRIHRVTPNSGEASVKITAREFNPDDYKYVIDEDDPFEFESFTGYRSEPVSLLAAAVGDNQDVNLTWVDDDEDASDAGFDIEERFVLATATGSIEDAEWKGLVTISNEDIREYSYAPPAAGQYQHRIRKFNGSLLKTDWTEATAITVVFSNEAADLVLDRFPTCLEYDQLAFPTMTNQTGLYRFAENGTVLGADWPTIRDRATRAVLSYQDDAGNDQLAFANELRNHLDAGGTLQVAWRPNRTRYIVWNVNQVNLRVVGLSLELGDKVAINESGDFNVMLDVDNTVVTWCFSLPFEPPEVPRFPVTLRYNQVAPVLTGEAGQWNMDSVMGVSLAVGELGLNFAQAVTLAENNNLRITLGYASLDGTEALYFPDLEPGDLMTLYVNAVQWMELEITDIDLTGVGAVLQAKLATPESFRRPSGTVQGTVLVAPNEAVSFGFSRTRPNTAGRPTVGSNRYNVRGDATVAGGWDVLGGDLQSLSSGDLPVPDLRRMSGLVVNQTDADGNDVSRLLDSVRKGHLAVISPQPEQWSSGRIGYAPEAKYSIVGTLPTGVTFDSESRFLSKAENAPAANVTVKLRATFADGTFTEQNVAITIT